MPDASQAKIFLCVVGQGCLRASQNIHSIDIAVEMQILIAEDTQT